MLLRLSRRVLISTLACSLASVPASTRAGTLTGGATEATQIGNNVQLCLQLSQQIIMVARLIEQCVMMRKQTRRDDSAAEATAIAMGFMSILGQFGQAAFVGRSLSEQWRATHPGAREPGAAGYATPSKAYDAIDRDLHQAADASLRALDVHIDPRTGAREQQIFDALKVKMLSAQGQMQAAQVANELLLEIVRQFHLLRQVVLVQTRMQTVGVSDEAQKRLYRSKVIARDYAYRGLYTGHGTGIGGLLQGGSVSSSPLLGNPSSDSPLFQQPSYDSPLYGAPSNSSPLGQPSSNPSPLAQPPSSDSPLYQAPSSDSPLYQAPSSDSPLYQAPSNDSPLLRGKRGRS